MNKSLDRSEFVFMAITLTIILALIAWFMVRVDEIRLDDGSCRSAAEMAQSRGDDYQQEYDACTALRETLAHQRTLSDPPEPR